MSDSTNKITPHFMSNNSILGFEEIILTNGTEIIFPDETIRRLRTLLNIYGINSTLPGDDSGTELKNEVKKQIIKLRAYKTARIKISFTKNIITGESTHTLIHEPDPYLFSTGKMNNSCIISNRILKPLGPTINLPNVYSEFRKLILAEMIESENDDSIILNENLSVSEAYSGNLFFIEDEYVVTPSIQTGCYPGILRNIVIKELKLMNLPVVEKDHITPEEILESKEIITAGNYGIFSVKGIEKRRYFDEYRNLLIARIVKKYLNA